MTSPAISVIMGAYNAEKYLGKAIDSILNQSFSDFEFIIINDGSKDSTGKIIDDYAAKDERVVAIHHDNMGHANSLNKALGLAKAPLIARMDADDIALPQRFEKQMGFLANHPEIAVLGTSIRLIDENDDVIEDIIYNSSSEDIAVQMLQASPVAHPTVIMRKNVLDEMNGYRAVFDPAEDYDLWLRISEKYDIANLPEIYLLYRQHSDKLSFKHSQYQTLCTFVMQLASKVRRSGKADPLANTGKVTAETLKLFDLTPQQEIDLLFRTYSYTVRSLLNENGKGIKDLFSLIKKQYNKDYSAKIIYLIKRDLFINFYNQGKYSKAYYHLLKAFPHSPKHITLEFARSLVRQLLPSSVKCFLKKIIKGAP